MNSRNVAQKFLTAWKNKDYSTMLELSTGGYSEADVSSSLPGLDDFTISYVSTNRTDGKRNVVARITADAKLGKISFAVIPEAGPFEGEVNSGVDFDSLFAAVVLKTQQSTDMTAKEAIEHIEHTPIDQLTGFVPDSEDRATVQRAMKEKEGQQSAGHI